MQDDENSISSYKPILFLSKRSESECIGQFVVNEMYSDTCLC